jgi:hypothetical protein
MPVAPAVPYPRLLGTAAAAAIVLFGNRKKWPCVGYPLPRLCEAIEIPADTRNARVNYVLVYVFKNA